MKKKYLLGLALVFLTVNFILVSTKAEINVVYSIEGNITYRTDDWRNSNVSKEEYRILYNISIPIELYGGDTLYWHQHYRHESTSLTILYQYNDIQSLLNFRWLIPGYSDSSNNTEICTVPNDSFGGNNTYVIVKRRTTLTSYDYHLTWEFWIERDIVEPDSGLDPDIPIGLTPILICVIISIIGMIISTKKKMNN